jgi:hypothetical protein
MPTDVFEKGFEHLPFEIVIVCLNLIESDAPLLSNLMNGER